METTEFSPRSRLVALLFCLLLGVFGAHRFYVGKIGTGILMLLTLGGLSIWTLIDLILIVAGSFRDKEGRRVFRWTEPGSM
jgi:TM2 domain-containing membrane protein YozV